MAPDMVPPAAPRLEVPAAFCWGESVKVTAYVEAIRKRPDQPVIQEVDRGAIREPNRQRVMADGPIIDQLWGHLHRGKE